MAKVKVKGFKEFERDLLGAVDGKIIHKRLFRDWLKELVNAIVAAAEAGIGPGDSNYPAYSEAYNKRIAKQGGQKRWLRGIGRGGRSGGMLAPKNFSGSVDNQGRAFLVWTAPDSTAAIYGAVHQEGTDKMPQRKWLHFESTRSAAALLKAYRSTLDKLAAMFSAGRRPK